MSNKLNEKYKTYKDKYEYCEILNVNKLLKYKLIKSNYYSNKYISDETPKHNTRQGNLLKIPKVQNKFGNRLNEVFIADLFNRLPNSLKNITKIGKLKKDLKTFLINIPEL